MKTLFFPSSERGVHAASPSKVTRAPYSVKHAPKSLRLSSLAAVFLTLVCTPHSVWACAACFGQSDSPMAKGLNWGIFSLLAVVAPVLGGIAAFFIYLARKSALAAQTSTEASRVQSFNSNSL
jgi:hypothetical protein